MQRSIFSLGILAALALAMQSRSLPLVSGSAPPSFTATDISRATLVNTLALAASEAPFLRLILFHLECPDIGKIVLSCDSAYYIRILAHPADADNLFCKILPLNSEKRLTKSPSFGMITDVAKDRLWTCGCSSMVEFQPSKLVTWVRFPSPAPRFACASSSAG